MACLSRQDDDQNTIDAQISAWETLKSVWNERPETHFSSNTELDSQYIYESHTKCVAYVITALCAISQSDS